MRAYPGNGRSEIEGSVEGSIEGTFEVEGLTCVLSTATYRGSSEAGILLPRDVFVYLLGGEGDDVALVESWGGGRFRSRALACNFSLLVPRGQRYVGKTTGSGWFRYLFCEIDHSLFTRVLGSTIGAFYLRSYSGVNLVASGLPERLASLCLDSDEFPLAYSESLAAMLAIELFNAAATKPIPREVTANVGSGRFKLVLEFIDEYLDRDIGLSELASLAGLSVTHFSHVFRASYGVSPYRYILQRRIKRAKTLLVTTDDTVAAIAVRVGYSSQSRFSADFTKLTGLAPSAYRSGPQKP